MAHKTLLVALSMVAAASSGSAAQPDVRPLEPSTRAPTATAAPPGTPDTRYCMRVELTGYVIDAVRCWTRAEWAEQGVDVDRDWHRDGVRVIPS
jgi:hypothetical protein